MKSQTFTTQEIRIRDPFILTDRESGCYYMYGTNGAERFEAGRGFQVKNSFWAYRSRDLENWEEPVPVFLPPQGFWADRDFWAPEVHLYRGRYYLFASFKSPSACRGTQIFVSDRPDGAFVPLSDGPVTPRDWECLDGTLYLSPDGRPYIVFCHEWLQIGDGTICCLPLAQDLSAPAGEPVALFSASEPPWALPDRPSYVTDGPFLHRCQNGELLMLWSSFAGSYLEAVSRSRTGGLTGCWEHDHLLFEADGGHGMLFYDLSGQLCIALHQPNAAPLERARFYTVREELDGVGRTFLRLGAPLKAL